MKSLATQHTSTETKANHKSATAASALAIKKSSVATLPSYSPLLQRKCACGGGCPRCQAEATLQPKLKLSEPGDPYEQEADRIADQVMQMAEPAIQRQAESEEEEEMVQRQAISPQDTFEVPPIIHEGLNSPGQPLDPETRTFMESRFGRDFSQVRVHTDAKASKSAQMVDALAYTVGRDIVFSTGQYAPQILSGQKLLAHELTHVVQQWVGQNQSFSRLGATTRSGIEKYQAQRVINTSNTRQTTIPITSGKLKLARQEQSTGSTVKSSQQMQDVIDALDEPNPIAGIGNHPKAYRILNSLSKTDLERTLYELHDRYYLEILLSADMPANVDQERFKAVIRKLKLNCRCPAGSRRPTHLEHLPLHRAFPRLISSDYCISGEAVSNYNCYAWTVNVTSREINKQISGQYVPGMEDFPDISISDFDKFYCEKLGLSPTRRPSQNSKVALFLIGDLGQHAAKMQSDSCFNAESKLGGGSGAGPRILHKLDQLEGSNYGKAERFYEDLGLCKKKQEPKEAKKKQ